MEMKIKEISKYEYGIHYLPKLHWMFLSDC